MVFILHGIIVMLANYDSVSFVLSTAQVSDSVLHSTVGRSYDRMKQSKNFFCYLSSSKADNEILSIWNEFRPFFLK